MLVSRSFAAILVLASGALVACGGGGNHDTPIDAAVTIDASGDGGCVTPEYTGEIIDWAANATTFCGVNLATATVRGQTSLTDMTNPNGRFMLCLAPTTNAITIDITPPANPSPCNSMKYTQPAVLVLQPTVISKPTLASVRLLSDSELLTAEGQIGQATQPDRGRLIVHIEGTPARATLSGIDPMSCAPGLQFNGTAWERVDTSKTVGTDVYFPDCMLMMSGSQPMPTTATVALTDGRSVQLTVEPNKFTYVTIPAP